jgi:hypothetical protein
MDASPVTPQMPGLAVAGDACWRWGALAFTDAVPALVMRTREMAGGLAGSIDR